MVQDGRSSRSSWTTSVWSSFGRTVMGKAIWENLIKIRLGESFQIGMLIRTPWNKGYSYLCMWVTSILAGKKQKIDPMWKVLNKEVDLGEPTSFFDHVYLGCTQRQCEISKDIVDKYRTMFWIQNFRRSNWRITMLGKSAYFFVVIWHGRSCQEMCGTILWVGEQNDSTTLQSTNSLHWPPSVQRRRIEIRGRIVKNMCSNCSEILIFGTYWTTRYSVVREQTCTINHKMDQSMWQTIISFDLLHSSYMWLQTILSCGKHCKTMQIGTVPRLLFCRRSWGCKIDHFSSINNLEAMSKRTPEDAGEEGVTAKSKPMMNLVSRYSVRDPNVLASTASESLVKTKSASPNVPLSSLNVQQTSTVRPVLGASSSNYSEWNIDDKWSSQVWKYDEMLGTSSVRPVDDKFVIDDDMDSDTATESNLSPRSRSFLNRWMIDCDRC